MKILLTCFTMLLTATLLTTTESSSVTQLQADISDPIYLRLLQSPCNSENCPLTQGFCREDQCICLDGFMTIPNGVDYKYCNYKQKNIIVALLLESFGFIGFGHFYAGRIFYGLVKLICFYVIICYGSQFVIAFMKENSDTETAYYIKLAISTSCLGVPVLWHLIDLYKWATNQYLDGNAQRMEGW